MEQITELKEKYFFNDRDLDITIIIIDMTIKSL